MDKGDLLIVTQPTYAYKEADTMSDDLGELKKADVCFCLGEKDFDFSLFDGGKTLMIKCLTRFGPVWVIRRFVCHARNDRRNRGANALRL